MRIWIDADACPGQIKELLFRAAVRTQTQVTLVARVAGQEGPLYLPISTVVRRATLRVLPIPHGIIEFHLIHPKV